MLTGSSDVAEEMVQDVFLAVWRRRERITPQDDLRAYLYAALRNAAKMRGRHTRVVRGVASAVEEQRLALPAHGRGPDTPDRRAEASEFYAAYQRALVVLNERERVAVQLRLEEDATFEEIGRVLGLSKVGARTVVLRAEEKIRALLAEYA
jgi:RNA polymerase sigma-70 factor (ECF subfamily)